MITMDFITSLPCPQNGHTALLVVVDNVVIPILAMIISLMRGGAALWLNA